MTREEAINQLQDAKDGYEEYLTEEAIEMAIQALSQEPCDAVSRETLIAKLTELIKTSRSTIEIKAKLIPMIQNMPSVTQKSGKCKNCKYFEYDSVAKVDGIPLIVAHEICNKWGDGCKTKEDGYCFLYEPQEGSDKE